MSISGSALKLAFVWEPLFEVVVYPVLRPSDSINVVLYDAFSTNQ